VGLSGDAPRTPPARISLAKIASVEICRGDARDVSRRGAAVAVALDDARMSRRHAQLTRVAAGWIVEDLGSKNGTWIDGRPPTSRPLRDGEAILVGHTALVFRDHGGDAEDLVAPSPAYPGLATMSPVLAARFAELAVAAASRVPIEIAGETGTGKELAARAVHALSGRSGRFVAVNCAALPASLLEAELFGHRRGAFTGAAEDRAGHIRAADGGTLFLDEIAELAPASQAALLRVLQDGEVVPLGSDRPIHADFRLISATHQDLDAAVAAGRYRADLRARTLGVRLALPPLRERLEDLGLMVASLLDRLAPGRAVSFTADSVAALYAHTWPLNVRALERSLAAALALAGERIELAQLALPTKARAAADVAALSAEELALRDRLADEIARHRGNVAAVGRALGKDRTQIRRWMKRFGLARDDGG
jgi:transcriptional regulator with GAF, ATPase, and Fis domain